MQKKKAEITSRAWDIVVAQDRSTLDAKKPGDPALLIATSKELSELIRARSPQVELFLTSTWSRADLVYSESGPWHGTPIDAMAKDVRAAYDRAAAAAGAKVIAVGDAFNRAMSVGFADTNPYDGIDAGKVDLWAFDGQHASAYGYYLEALMVFGRVTGRDPRSLGDGECSGMELGLSPAQVGKLQQIAFDELATTVPIAPSPKATIGRAFVNRCPKN
jgi:hypothetical protein